MLSTDHYLDLVDGRFRQTSAADLEALFKSLNQSAEANHLAVYFHGGLVSRASARTAAEGLEPYLRGGGAYPVFFIWNSDLLTTLTANLDEIAQEDVFKRLVRRVIQFALGKLGETAGARGGTLELKSLKEIPAEPVALGAFARTEEKTLPAGEVSPELTATQRQQIQLELEKDPVIREQSLAIASGLRTPEEVDRELATQSRGGPAVRASTRTRMSPRILKRLAEESPEPATRGLSVLTTLAIEGVKIVIAVLKRFAKGIDHGLHTTVVEEILRALYLDNLGTLTWTMIKKDTADAFGNDPQVHGGTAFTGYLAKWWRPGRRLTLIGHSTGAIYIGHLLDAIDPLLPAEAKADVLLLAPACTFGFLHERLDLIRRRVANLRLFALTDAVERGYWEVPVIYPASLLYLVSGLCEDPEVDQQIAGMQRYHPAAGPYDVPAISEVTNYLKGRCVWAPVDDGDGRRSTAQKHGEFDDDVPTRESLRHILKNGF